jgi:hypothetical protein
MKAVASCNLTPYQAPNLNGFKNATAKGLACHEFLLKLREGDPQGCALDPDQSICRNACRAEQVKSFHQPLAAYQAHLGAVAVRHQYDNGRDSRRHEMCVSGALSGSVENRVDG